MFMSYATSKSALLYFFSASCSWLKLLYICAQLNPINAYNTIMKEDPMMFLINIRSLPLPVLKHLPRQWLSFHLVLDIHSWFPSSLLGSTRLAGLGRRLALGTCKGRWPRSGFGGLGRGLRRRRLRTIVFTLILFVGDFEIRGELLTFRAFFFRVEFVKLLHKSELGIQLAN